MSASSAQDAGPSKKRPRPDIPEEDLLEIDVAAPEPLSKADARAAKKRAKQAAKAGRKSDAALEGSKKKRSKVKHDDQADLLEDQERMHSQRGPRQATSAPPTSAKPKIKPKNSIWIGNLSFRTTPESLKAFLEKGVVELGGREGGVTRVNLPKTGEKAGFSQNKGFAYVDFESEELQALAVGLSERVLEGRKVLIKLGTDHTANPEARTPKPAKGQSSSTQPHGESSTLFVGNLPFDATEESVRDLVEVNAGGAAGRPVGQQGDAARDAEAGGQREGVDGEVKEAGTKGEASQRGGAKSSLRKVRLGQFEDTGRCKGFGFLDFFSPQSATAALRNRKNHFLDGRKLVLQYASEDATKRSGTSRIHAQSQNTHPHAPAIPNSAANAASRPPNPPSYKNGSTLAVKAERKLEKGQTGQPPRDKRKYSKEGRAEMKAERIAAGGKPWLVNRNRNFSGLPVSGTNSVAPRLRAPEPDPVRSERPLLRSDADKPREPRRRDGLEATELKMERKPGADVRGKKWEAAGRPRPGAALAMAKREKVGIVEGKGEKIVFD